MAIIFALPRLFDAVVARFAAVGPVGVEQSFGWLARVEQMRAAKRIVWTPGDEGGNLGAVVPPKYVGQKTRQVATLLELCTVEISAFDTTASANERVQYQGARELHDAWLEAVELTAYGTYKILSSKWVGGERTRRAGAALRTVFSLQTPILTTPVDTAPVDTGAAIGVHELDVGEPLDVPAP